MKKSTHQSKAQGKDIEFTGRPQQFRKSDSVSPASAMPTKTGKSKGKE